MAIPEKPFNFHRSFEAWAADASTIGTLRQSSSTDVYRAIWNSFAAWCLAHTPPVDPTSIGPWELQRFLESRRGNAGPAGETTNRYAWTILNLIQRILRHAAEARGAEVNVAPAGLIAARPALRYANTSDPALPDHLSAGLARALVRFLVETEPSPSVPMRWQELRNRTAVGLQLGGGLAPGDVRAMTLQRVISADATVRPLPWKLRVPADGNTPERETPLARWASRLLGRWLATREAQAIPGEWLFPSTASGKPWSKMAQYRAAQDVLKQAGVPDAEGGSFKLRHTFAVRQLRRGQSPEDVARWMGIARLETLARYRRVLHSPMNVD